jgi:hypothetical protein
MIGRMLLALFYLVVPLACLAQMNLSGKVLASENRQPIASVNVYLSNSSVGTITNEAGAFTIHNFPAGRYDLVISCIGYETQIITVSSNRLPKELTILLKQKINELQEVVVQPYEKNGWEKWGQFFLDNLIGTSEYAADCKLKNPGVVKFRYDKKAHIISAYADEPLVIENNALGYHLRYTMTMFEYRQDTRIMYYQGYPLFEEMQTKRERLKKRWLNNRKDCYNGSMMHFMRSLYRNKLIEQGFEVRRLIKISDEEKARVKKILINNKTLVLSDNRSGVTFSVGNDQQNSPQTGSVNPDSAAYYRKVMQKPDALNILVDQLLPGDSIAYAIDSVTAGFAFPDALQIRYRYKKPSEAYMKSLAFGNRGVMMDPITSELIRPHKNEIAVLANGSYFNGIDLLSSGYWAWSEKLATMLPTDYWPPQ